MANALELLEKAMALPRAERSFVAERLLESLDGDSPLSAEWSEEIARRVSRRESGESRVYTQDEIHREVRALLSK